MHRPQPRALILLALLAAAGPPATARAQPAQPADATPSPDAVKRADGLFRNGNQLYAEKKWAEAEAAFLAAWALNPTYDVAANLGHTQYRLGKYRDAAEHLAFALRTWPLIGKPEPRKLAEDRLAELRTLVGVVTVEIAVEKADVYVDGKRVGQTPLAGELFVEPGRREVEARHEVHGREMVVLDVEKGASVVARFTMGVARPKAAEGSEKGPPSNPPVVVTPAPTKPPIALLVVGGVLAVGGLSAGAGLTVAANGKGADRVALLGKVGGASGCAHITGANMDNCAALLQTAQSQSPLRNGAVAVFATGGGLAVLTAAGAVWWAAGKHAPRRDGVRVQVAPALGTTEHGVVVSGTW